MGSLALVLTRTAGVHGRGQGGEGEFRVTPAPLSSLHPRCTAERTEGGRIPTV